MPGWRRLRANAALAEFALLHGLGRPPRDARSRKAGIVTARFFAIHAKLRHIGIAPLALIAPGAVLDLRLPCQRIVHDRHLDLAQAFDLVAQPRGLLEFEVRRRL